MQFYKKENFTKKNQSIISKQEKLFLIIKKNKEFYINQVNSYLTELNVLNANYLWWSFNLSSKSLLSTTIVGKIIDVLGVLDLEGEDLFNLSDYQNFSNGQKKVLFKYFKIKLFCGGGSAAAPEGIGEKLFLRETPWKIVEGIVFHQSLLELPPTDRCTHLG